jgi:hypothetical protein
MKKIVILLLCVFFCVSLFANDSELEDYYNLASLWKQCFFSEDEQITHQLFLNYEDALTVMLQSPLALTDQKNYAISELFMYKALSTVLKENPSPKFLEEESHFLNQSTATDYTSEYSYSLFNHLYTEEPNSKFLSFQEMNKSKIASNLGFIPENNQYMSVSLFKALMQIESMNLDFSGTLTQEQGMNIVQNPSLVYILYRSPKYTDLGKGLLNALSINSELEPVFYIFPQNWYEAVFSVINEKRVSPETLSCYKINSLLRTCSEDSKKYGVNMEKVLSKESFQKIQYIKENPFSLLLFPSTELTSLENELTFFSHVGPLFVSRVNSLSFRPQRSLAVTQ